MAETIGRQPVRAQDERASAVQQKAGPRPENAPADRVARPAPLPVSVRWPIVRWWSWAGGVAHARHFKSRGQAVCGARLHRNACYATGQTELCPACVEVLEATRG